MPILGLRTTGNFVANQRPENWRETLLMLYPSSPEAAKAPLTALTSRMKSEKTDDPIFHWWEKALDDRRLKINEALDDTETGISVDNTYKLAFIVKAGDLLMIEGSGEIVRVASDPTVNNEVIVTRGYSGTTATIYDPTAAGMNPFMVVIGSAFEEGSLAPTGVSYDPNEKSNYTQIFRSTMEMTRTAMQSRLRTGDQVKEARRECLEYVGIDMERGFWFGKKAATTLNGKPLRTTDGLISQITANAPSNVISVADYDPDGAIDLDYIEEKIMEPAFRYGSNEKIAFGSNQALLALTKAVRKNATFTIESGVKEYNMSFTKITTGFGTLMFKVHPLFNQMTGGLNGGTFYTAVANNVYILDMQFVRYRYLQDLKYEGDLAAVGQDAMKAGYLAECGIEVHHPSAHFIITGLRTGKKDAA